jgi:hypothetical protein
MLVGDLIQSCREAITDQPQVVSPPFFVTNPNAVAGGVLAPNTYFVTVTALNQWGETIGSTEQNVVIASPNNTISMGVFFQPGTTGARVYVSSASGFYAGYLSFAASSGAFTFTVSDISALIPGSPATRNSAYLPDTDGPSVNAASMFRWMNDALKVGSQVCGGLLDYCGISSITGQPQYFVPGLWKKLASVWYDGYPLVMDDNGNFFRRNAITASVLSGISLSTFR